LSVVPVSVIALVTRWNTPGARTSAAATCGSLCASGTTMPSFTSLFASRTFWGVMKFVVPLDSSPTGAQRPQVLNSVRHFSYWARSAAVSGGAGGEGACAAGAGWALLATFAPTRPALASPAHMATDARRFLMHVLP
jgi:hypothetical protein